jgi:cytochrome c oxidase subunit 2
MRRSVGLTISFVVLAFTLQCAIFALGASLQEMSPKIIEISAKKYEFSPDEIRVKKGERVELKVHSVDETHGIKIDVYPEEDKAKKTPGLSFENREMNGKVEKNVDQVLGFVATEPGTYDFKCAKLCGMGHGRMQGKLIVEP